MSHQPQPGPTLLSTWITLINQANIEYLSGNYIQAWRTFSKGLFTWLPLECKEDCRKQKEIIDKKYMELTKSNGVSYVAAHRNLTNQVNNYLFEAIPIFAELIESSLETKKWVHREENAAHPRNDNKPHIGE